MRDRRAFLSGLVSLPLIGGGVTLIGKPAAAVPLVQAAALPTLDDARQRARYAWGAFEAAMDELSAADADGWRVQAFCYKPGSRFGLTRHLDVTLVSHVYGRDGRYPGTVFEDQWPAGV